MDADDFLNPFQHERPAPPLGLTPRWLHQQQVDRARAGALAAALGRCLLERAALPAELLDEYHELQARLSPR